MGSRRITYLAGLLTCLVFYLFYGEWFSAVALAVVLGLPWLSLLLSLPGILGFRMSIDAPAFLTQGEEGEAWLLGSSRFPLPHFRGELGCRKCITGERLHSGGPLPTGHCGGLELSVERARVLDYLGLFAFPVRRKEQKRILVRPRPLVIPDLSGPSCFLPRRWQPKAGGGFSENHELRQYRPGDSLNQVHWKLTAKTGALTIREPLVPQRGLILLTMDLGGTPEELDRKFGRLLWLGSQLNAQEVPFEVRCLTGLGLQTFSIRDELSLTRAIDQLLCAPALKTGTLRDLDWAVSWRYHIGGDLHED